MLDVRRILPVCHDRRFARTRRAAGELQVAHVVRQDFAAKPIQVSIAHAAALLDQVVIGGIPTRLSAQDDDGWTSLLLLLLGMLEVLLLDI